MKWTRFYFWLAFLKSPKLKRIFLGNVNCNILQPILECPKTGIPTDWVLLCPLLLMGLQDKFILPSRPSLSKYESRKKTNFWLFLSYVYCMKRGFSKLGREAGRGVNEKGRGGRKEREKVMTVEPGGQKSERASGGASLQGGTCSIVHLANIQWMPPEGQCWVIIMAPWTNPGPNIWSLWSPLSLKRTLDSFGLWIQHSSSTVGETQFIFFFL